MFQGDTLRYMLLHKYGGLYIDLDVQCFSSIEDSLGNYTIVLQGTGIEGVTNAVMASAPGNSFWLDVLKVCQNRAGDPNYKNAIFATGPIVVGEALKARYHVDPWARLGFTGDELKVLLQCH